MTIKANINRLLRLAAFIRDELTDDGFDMSDWSYYQADVDGGPTPDHMPKTLRKTYHGCGMVGCIGGWATKFHPDLQLTPGGDVVHVKTRSWGSDAFVDAFDPDGYGDCYGLTLTMKSRLEAADKVEQLAKTLADANDYEIVEV